MDREQQKRQILNIAVLLLFLVGNVLTIVSLAAEILGLDLTPGFGMVQMLQLLLGLTLLTLAGYLHIYSLRPPGSPRSLQADIGIRLAATGLVFAYVSGLSDLMGIGTHVQPSFERPFVGPLQLGGLVLGIFSITFGLVLFHTSRGSRESSAFRFLINGSQKEEAAELGPITDADGEPARAPAMASKTLGEIGEGAVEEGELEGSKA